MYDTSHQPEAMQVRYKYLPPSIIELFEYQTVQFVIDETAKEFGLNDEKKAALLMEIELILFFFTTRVGFVERLRDSLEVDQRKATQIAAKVETDLFSIVDQILDAAEAEFESVEEETPVVEATQNEVVSTSPNSQPEPTATTAEPASLIVEPKPNTTVPPTPEPIVPPPITTVKPMRTFPDDFNAGRAHSYGAFRPEGEDNDPDEPIHSSSQDDVLRK